MKGLSKESAIIYVTKQKANSMIESDRPVNGGAGYLVRVARFFFTRLAAGFCGGVNGAGGVFSKRRSTSVSEGGFGICALVMGGSCGE
jgi:hypothetical protein